jgi:hypothetical protein
MMQGRVGEKNISSKGYDIFGIRIIAILYRDDERLLAEVTRSPQTLNSLPSSLKVVIP